MQHVIYDNFYKRAVEVILVMILFCWNHEHSLISYYKKGVKERVQSIIMQIKKIHEYKNINQKIRNAWPVLYLDIKFFFFLFINAKLELIFQNEGK